MSLRAALLGFLSLEPTSGYSLKQRFDGSVRSFWNATQSQIYRELHALEAGGMVSARREPGDGKPDRKLYALTPLGKSELQAWLEAPLEPLQLRHPMLLKLVFASEQPPEALDELLANYRDGLAKTHAEYEARLTMKEIFVLARSKREAEIWRLSIEHGLMGCATEMLWIDQARRRLRRLPVEKKPQHRSKA